MKVFVILSVLLAAAYADLCLDAVTQSCENKLTGENPEMTDLSTTCNSITGHFIKEQKHLQAYAENLIEKSYDYLLLSINFGLYTNNRDGLKGYYRKLSDQTWEDAIDLIKYITKRGGQMKFGVWPKTAANNPYKYYSLNEIRSLAKALELQKSLAKVALRLYSESLKLETYGTASHMDGSIAHYLEEKFIAPQMTRVRDLAGHFNDLQKILREPDPAVSIFMFDEFLKKSL